MSMELLLDTHILLWALFEPERLSESTKSLIEDMDNRIFVSMASLWEIEIKHRRRPDTMPYSAELVLGAISFTDFRLLPITEHHVLGLGSFLEQNIHNDPFDHLLLAASSTEQMTLLTHDENIARYHNALLRVG